MKKESTAGIILAAGMSTRLGQLKQLLKVGGKTILSMVIDAALFSDLDKILLVLGHQSDKIIAAMGDKLRNPKLSVIINSRYQEGMSTSIQCAMEKIKDDFSSFMIILGDQPLLSKDTINFILSRFWASNKGICVPVHKGKRGPPVCFSNEFYDDIFNISGDIGAREIIKNKPEHTLDVEIEDSDCFFDIDNEADLERLLSRMK